MLLNDYDYSKKVYIRNKRLFGNSMKFCDFVKIFYVKIINVLINDYYEMVLIILMIIQMKSVIVFVKILLVMDRINMIS